MKRFFRFFAIAIVAIASFASCGSDDDPTPDPTPTPAPTPTIPDYFAIEALDDGTEVTFVQDVSGYIPTTIPEPKLLYSRDGQTWDKVAPNSPVTLNKNEKIMFKADEGGNKKFYEYDAVRYGFDTQDAKFRINVSGNIMYLLDGVNPPTAMTAENSYAFNSFFKNCRGLVSAKELKLPATTLAKYCYDNMFSGCTSLTIAPEISATTLAQSCCRSMFWACQSLVEAPELPATTLAEFCYYSMFEDCTSLTKAPELPATTLCDNCYVGMFKGCTSLAEAPELPATTLASICYEAMFKGCTSLTKAPELPATTLDKSCYGYMFYGCKSLKEAPELPATTLASSCYEAMFRDCTSLTKAPELPATTLVDECYAYMFSGCKQLNEVRVHFTDWNESKYCTYNWLYGVSAFGMVYHTGFTNPSTKNANTIPSGWVPMKF